MRCSQCGEDRPLEQFIKHRALMAGKAYAGKEAWRCDTCMAGRTKLRREDPESRERDQRSSLAWKDRNRERNRARDREYQARRRREA